MADRLLALPTRQQLKAVRANVGRAYEFLELFTLDTCRWYDDFLGDTVRGDATAPGTYEIKTGSDGVINILADQTNGIAEIRASDGNGSINEYCCVALPELGFMGDLNATVAMRLAIDAITTVKVEMGFTDVTTDVGAVKTAGLATVGDGNDNSMNAADAALWVFDTDDTASWQCVGVKTGAEPTKIEDGQAPEAGTFQTLIVSLEGDQAKFIRLDANGYKLYESAWMADAIEGGTKICPWIFIELKAGTIDRNIQLDYIHAWQRRTAT